jgi:hypothetical protein
MTPNKALPINFSILTGRHEEARYIRSSVPIYPNNPLIEALPRILTKKEAMRRLGNFPPYSPANRQLSAEERLHCVDAITQLVQPVNTIIHLENMFSCAIRTGYSARNPYQKEFWTTLDQKIDRINQDNMPRYHCRSKNHGFAVVGISGIGKSTGVDSTLNLYPQVIFHKKYKNHPFSYTQVVWLKIECPGDASIKGLCLSFFLAMDEVLGTNYYHDYARDGRATVDILLPSMARVAGIHSLGVLVVDEAQNLSEANVGGERKLLNYLVQLENIVGVPVVLVGTSKLLPILGKNDFRQARRMTGEGELIWDRMKKDDEWGVLVCALWRYQYTREKCILTDEISDVLYDLSQGITDVVVKIIKLAQIRAIETGKERISANILRSVAIDSLKLLKPALTALRNGDSEVISRFDDIYPVWNLHIGELPLTNKPVGSMGLGEVKPLLEIHEEKMPNQQQISAEVQLGANPTRSSRKKGPWKKRKTIAEASLMGIVADGKKRKIPAYEAFRMAGIISAKP